MASRKFTVSKEVTAQLAADLGATDVEIIHVTAATVAGLGEVHAVTAVASGRPNTVATTTVDADGVIRRLAELVALAGHDVFAPTFTPGRFRPAAPTAPITIDPTTNDWTLSKCEEHREKITVTVPKGSAPKADVYLLADTTGSMGPVLAAVKAGASGILNHPGLVGYDVAWGVGNYRDFPVGTGLNSYAFQHQLAPTTNHVPADAAISAWSANEGSDGPEGQLNALEQLATDAGIGWRSDAKKIIVWFGDAPGHDPICTSLTGLAADITEATATAALQAAQVSVVAVGTTTGFLDDLDDDPNAGAVDYGACAPAGSAGQATRITAATSGSYTKGVDPDTVATTLGDLIAAAVSTIGNVHLVATGGTAQFVESITPAGGYGPLKGDTEHVLTFELVWRGVKACAEKKQEFTGTIDVVADGSVVAQKKVRVTVPPCRYHHSVEFLCRTEKQDADGTEKCLTVEPGHYSTVVTIYNPLSCPVVIEKRFAPLVRNGEPEGREPRKVPAKPFAKIVLQPGEATMDDCCAIAEAVGNDPRLLVGVLDIVASHPLDVTVTHTVTGSREAGVAGITSRTVRAHRAP
jgi:hypothetical protein